MGAIRTRSSSVDHASDLGFRTRQPEGRSRIRQNPFQPQYRANALTLVFAIPHIRYLRYIEHRPDDDGGWLLHGHVHEKWRQNGRQINVGVDAWNFAPGQRRHHQRDDPRRPGAHRLPDLHARRVGLPPALKDGGSHRRLPSRRSMASRRRVISLSPNTTTRRRTPEMRPAIWAARALGSKKVRDTSHNP